MRHKKLFAVTMTAVMILSGCNTDKPADASAVTEEVTTTTTAESTTTGATTTTSSTAAAKLETAKKYFVDCNERPFDSKARVSATSRCGQGVLGRYPQVREFPRDRRKQLSPHGRKSA